MHLEGLAVDHELTVLDFDLAEADARRGAFEHAAAVAEGEHEGVEVGCLSAPSGHVFEACAEGCIGGGACAYGEDFACGSHAAPCCVIEVHLKAGRGSGVAGVGHGHVEVEDAVLIGSVEVGMCEEIEDAHGSHAVEVDVAVDARETPEVLVLKVGAVGPAVHLACYLVGAGVHILRDVEFGGVLCALDVARLVAVDPYVHTCRAAVEMQDGAASLPVGGDVEGALVASHGVVVVGDIGPVLGEGIDYVGVDGCAVAQHLPVGGHGDVVPAGGVVARLPEIGRAVGRLGCEAEFPGAVEAAEIGRLLVVAGKCGVLGGVGIGCGARGEASFGEDCGILPVVGGEGRCGAREGEDYTKSSHAFHGVTWNCKDNDFLL